MLLIVVEEMPFILIRFFSDAYNQEWLLTDNGLLKITNDKEEPVSYFVNIQSGKDEPVQAFYSFCSYGDELYFWIRQRTDMVLFFAE